ncbi:MAG: OadG family transporter subunit [Bacteroidales bacterium]
MGLPVQVFILGLLTVFVVLLVVVYTGRVIIWFVNRFFEPAPVRVPVKGTGPASLKKGRIAAISAAVHIVTKGKGKVAKIEKL